MFDYKGRPFRKGFQMIELIMIMVVIGSLAGTGVHFVNKKIQNKKDIEQHNIALNNAKVEEIKKHYSKKEIFLVDNETQSKLNSPMEKPKEIFLVDNETQSKLNSPMEKPKEIVLVDNEIKDSSLNQKKMIDSKKVNDEFSFFILLKLFGLIFLLGILITLLTSLIDFILFRIKTKKNDLENKLFIEKYDLNKYKTNLSNPALKKLNEIDKNLINNIFIIIKNDKSIDFLKEQLRTLYLNSYKILEKMHDLQFVIDEFNRNKNLDEELNNLLNDNLNTFKELELKFNKNLNAYSYLLLQLPKLNYESNIDDVNEDFKNIISNIVQNNFNNENHLNNLKNKYVS